MILFIITNVYSLCRKMVMRIIQTSRFPFDFVRWNSATATMIANTSPLIKIKKPPAMLLSDSDFFFEPCKGQTKNNHTLYGLVFCCLLDKVSLERTS